VVALHVCTFPHGNNDNGLGHGKAAYETKAMHVLAVCFRAYSPTYSQTFITALTAAAVAAIAVVLAMATHGDEREREQSLMHHCVTNASTSTPQAFHSRTNLFALISLRDHVPCFRSQNTTKKSSMYQ